MPFETFLLSFCISVGIIDFSMIALGKAHIVFTPISLIASIITSLCLAALSVRIVHRSIYPSEETESSLTSNNALGAFSRTQGLLFIILLILTVLIKTIYLSHTVLPTATDLGHHMYWSEIIAETGTLPNYAKQSIVTGDDGHYAISDPEPIADFIIGEHLPFAAIHLFSKADFFSAFPVVFLFFINLLSVFALAVFALRIAADMRQTSLNRSIFTPTNIALATVFFFGPIYSLSSPQAKFVSGGVVGNTFGNLFIPLILLVFYRAFSEKRSGLLTIAFFLTFTLAYTHHLSTLMLLFVLVATALFYLICNKDTLKVSLLHWWKLFKSPAPILFIIGAFTFFFFVAMPTYIETHAVGTALGTPTKSTRTGLTLLQVFSSNGEARVALGLAGAMLIFAASRIRQRYAGAFVLGWGIILFIMTVFPEWLFINIPSNRIGAYLSFPFGILASIATVMLFALFRSSQSAARIPRFLFFIASCTFFVFSSASGSIDNGSTLIAAPKSTETVQTFAASDYLASRISQNDILLKDHIYITADSWIKLFFMRDYSYPFSRGFLKRYSDNPNREQCTLYMISTPNTAKGRKCFEETGTNLIMVNPSYDAAQFEKTDDFSLIYESEYIDIYRRK